MTRLAVWLTLVALASSASAQAPTVVLDGKAIDASTLNALAKDASEALSALQNNPGTDPAAAEERKNILAAERDALQQTAALLQTIAAATATTTGLEAELAEARELLTAARNAGREKPRFTEIQQEELDQLESAVTAAESERSNAVTLKARADETVKNRTARFESIAASITTATDALAEVAKELAAATDDAVRAGVARRHRTAELEVRILELTRSHHQPLLKLETADQAVKATRAELAEELAKNAQANVTAGREAEAKMLDAEAARKAAEAARKEEEAKNATLAHGAVLTVESLASAFEAKENREGARKTRITAFVRRATDGLERILSRNEVVARLFPEGAELDGWKVEALDGETRRLEAAQRLLENTVHRPAIALAAESRDWFLQRDRLQEFLEVMEQARDPIIRDTSLEEFHGTGIDDNRDRYVEAIRTFNDPNSNAALWTTEFNTADGRLKQVVGARIKHLGELDAEASKLFDIHREIGTALEWRRRYLAKVSLWIKSPAPFGKLERKAAFKEIRVVGTAIANAPSEIGNAWDRWSALDAGSLWLPALILGWVAIALLGGPVIGRRIRSSHLVDRPRTDLDSLGAALKVLLSVVGRAFPSLLLLAGASWLAWVQVPGDPVAAVLLAGSGGYWTWRASGILADVVLGRDGQPGLVICEDKTARRARRISLLLLRGFAVLFPIAHLLESLGHHRLSMWFYVVLGAWSVIVSAWLIVRRDALLLIVPKEGGLLARTFRALLPYVWPIAVAYYGVVVILAIQGYRNAAWHYGSRFLLCAAVLLAGAIVFQMLAALLRRRLGPRNQQEEKAMENPSAERATTRLVAFRILTSLLFFLVAAASILGFSTILGLEGQDWTDAANHELMNLSEKDPLRLGDVVQAFLVLFAGLGIARWTRDSIRVAMASRMQRGSRYVVRTLVYYSLVAITVVMAFAALGLNLDQLGWFLAAAGVGIGFGLQEVISNFIAGLILFFERPVQVGDIISVGSVEGDVTRINIRSTEVRTRDGISIIIPNKRFITDDVINWSHGDQRTRLRVTVGVAYGSDVTLVKQVLTEVGKHDDRVLKFPQPEVNFREFGESELGFELMVWLKSPDPTLRRHVMTALNSAVDASFREHNIQIPFPQRDLHLKTNEAGLGNAIADDDRSVRDAIP